MTTQRYSNEPMNRWTDEPISMNPNDFGWRSMKIKKKDEPLTRWWRRSGLRVSAMVASHTSMGFRPAGGFMVWSAISGSVGSSQATIPDIPALMTTCRTLFGGWQAGDAYSGVDVHEWGATGCRGGARICLRKRRDTHAIRPALSDPYFDVYVRSFAPTSSPRRTDDARPLFVRTVLWPPTLW